MGNQLGKAKTKRQSTEQNQKITSLSISTIPIKSLTKSVIDDKNEATRTVKTATIKTVSPLRLPVQAMPVVQTKRTEEKSQKQMNIHAYGAGAPAGVMRSKRSESKRVESNGYDINEKNNAPGNFQGGSIKPQKRRQYVINQESRMLQYKVSRV